MLFRFLLPTVTEYDYEYYSDFEYIQLKNIIWIQIWILFSLEFSYKYKYWSIELIKMLLNFQNFQYHHLNTNKHLAFRNIQLFEKWKFECKQVRLKPAGPKPVTVSAHYRSEILPMCPLYSIFLCWKVCPLNIVQILHMTPLL